jgi:hypothetical protein
LACGTSNPALQITVLKNNREKQTTADFKIIDVSFLVFQRFSCSKLVLKTVESRFVALNYFEISSKARQGTHALPGEAQ